MARTKTRADAGDVARQRREYLASLSPAGRRALRQLREVARAAAPGAIDAFSYRIPALRLDGRALLWYAGWKEHVSLYPIGEAIRRTYAKDLEGYATSKGTVRFRLSEPLPVGLVTRLVKARVAALRAESSPARTSRARTARRATR